jgi:hypothetical protein
VLLKGNVDDPLRVYNASASREGISFVEFVHPHVYVCGRLNEWIGVR